jgi:tRNA A37 threonylcarbamoyladenosine modification protein TsaB
VSMSLAKGIGLALGVPIVGVPSLEAWLAAAPEASAAVVRAGAQESFVLLRGESEPRLVTNGELASTLGGATAVAPSELATVVGFHAGSPAAAAAAVAAIAAERLVEHPAGDDLERLEPRYLRASHGRSIVDRSEAS